MAESKESRDRDLAWVPLPGRSVWVRKGRRRVKEWKADVPVILRNLAPQTGFNPGLLWEKEKAMEEAESKSALLMEEADSKDEKKKGKGGGAGKKQKAGKSKEEIIAEQILRAEKQKYMRDMERLTNTRQNEGLSRVITLRNLETELGQLERLLMILADTVERADKGSTYDVLWGIEAHPQYLKALEELRAAKEESKDGEKSKSKSKSSSSSKKKASSDDIPTASEVLMKYKAAVRQATIWRKAEDMIVKQLTDMSDSLPPLSKFSGKFRLDNWQKQVLRWIDDNQSVVVAAPTSSGKTIISTYVAHLGRSRPITQEEQEAAQAQLASAREAVETGNEDELEEISDEELWGGEEQTNRFRVLFVVPTEPLVWQVAAHFNAHLLQGDVALISNQMKFSPNRKKSNDDTSGRVSSPPAVIVGTPLALESSLTKVRGYVRLAERTSPHIDRGDLPGGFDVFRWVVYDEVHSLDGEEGGALQRLVRLVNCNFLALSATIGNAEQLRDWMQSVRRQQTNVRTITVQDMEHQGRFMNLQQHVWVKPAAAITNNDDEEKADEKHQDDEEETPGLALVHPLAAATLDFLKADGFSQASLPFTPRDSYMLWQRLCRHFPKEQIEELDPHTYFAGTPRITLQHTKEYETLLKAKLQTLAVEFEAETEQLLEGFRLPEPPADFNFLDMCLELRQKEMLPALAFHLNGFEAIHLFQSLLHDLEARQAMKYPDYHTERENKIKQQDAKVASAMEGVKTDKEKEAIMRETGADLSSKYELDEHEPHPEFCMQRNTLGLRDLEEIAKEVAKHDFKGDAAWGGAMTSEKVKEHALLRGLRRGIALYIDEVTLPAYRRAVMKLAMQGKLAVVCSDSSLAYGVNMPFRTCIFCSEMQGLLDPLMAQQMSGRAGRRGLDTQGHLVYAGARAGFIREIMLGRIPAIHGRDPLHHFMAIPEILLSPAFHTADDSGLRMTPFVNPSTYPQQMEQLGLQTLASRIAGTEQGNFMHLSRQTLVQLGFVEQLSNGEFAPARNVRKQELHLMWEMRSAPSDGYLLGKALQFLYEYFIHEKREDVEEPTQLELFYVLLHLIDRKPCRSEPVVSGSTEYGAVSLQAHPYRQERNTAIERVEAIVAQSEALLDGIEGSDRLRSPVAAGEPLDSLLFDCIRLQSIVHDMPSRDKYEVKNGIWQVGTAILHLHNCIYPDRGYYGKLQILLQKCFGRLMYLTRELMFEKLNVEDVSNFDNEKARLRRVRLQAVRKAPAKNSAK